VKEIPLSRGLVALVDDEDFGRVSQFKWSAADAGRGRFYASRGTMKKGRRQTIYMHRFIMSAPAGCEVDHRNGDSLDNRRSNLRLCTRSQNQINRPTPTDKAFPWRGVTTVNSAKRPYRVQIRTTVGRRLYIGCFADPVEAARAYDDAARKYHGEFARLNFPEAA
jgi:hypothetical protein